MINLANKYTMTFPYTEEQLHDLYVNKIHTQSEIGKMFGVSQKKVGQDLKRMGIISRRACKRNQWGESNSSWKGGRILVGSTTPEGHRISSDPKGKKKYYMVLCRNHPNSNKYGYVFEHVKVALESAGRDCLNNKFECVHHINCVKTDNKPENLIICTKDKHREYHSSLENLLKPLLENGSIGFDAERGYFVI